MHSTYYLIGNPSITKKDHFSIKSYLRSKIYIIFFLLTLFLLVNVSILDLFLNWKKLKRTLSRDQIIPVDDKYLFIKGGSRKDKYGIDLNANLLDGIYSIGYNENVIDTIEETKIYTPPCPNLRPVHYPDSIIHPECEGASLQFVNFNNNDGKGLPHSLKLDSITNQIIKWKGWRRTNKPDFNYYVNKTTEDLVQDQYYPFDYGDPIQFEDETSDEKFYKKVIESRMDEIPDPRRRRLFSFILFNGEFDLLDMYLAEYYEIVDYFVIYESNMTFTGNPKPLYFTRTLLETDRYDRFKDKLIPLPRPIVVNDDNGRGVSFPREHVARRELIENGLRSVHARHGDLYMHSDLDEFPKSHILSKLKKCGGWEHLQAGIGGGPRSFKKDQKMDKEKEDNEKVESYFTNGDDVPLTRKGEYQINYERVSSVSFLLSSHEYSLTLVENPEIGTVAHPNLAIFDARKSLGQYHQYKYDDTYYYEAGDIRINKTNTTTTITYKNYSKKIINNININNNNNNNNNNSNNNGNNNNNSNINNSNNSNNNNNSSSSNDNNKKVEEKINNDNDVNKEESHIITVHGNVKTNTTSDENDIERKMTDPTLLEKVITKRSEERERGDPISDPNFDPYQGYTYTNNTNDRFKGKGYLGEYLRFYTGRPIHKLKYMNKPLLWNGGWHLSSCLPTIEQILNKVSSYSHFMEYQTTNMNFIKYDVIQRIRENSYIFGEKKEYYKNRLVFPKSYTKGYSYHFDYAYWYDNTSNNKTSTEEFNSYLNILKHEVPTQIWKNPFCYSYMLDRDFGLEKKLWWQVIPKKLWKTIKFEKLNPSLLLEILPNNIPLKYLNEMFESSKKENN